MVPGDSRDEVLISMVQMVCLNLHVFINSVLYCISTEKKYSLKVLLNLNKMSKTEWFPSLISGACAGLIVDVSLYPLDTLKTRLQSGKDFRKVGGFRGIYKGMGPVILGSAPGAALFFVTYDTSKKFLGITKESNSNGAISYMMSACLGEVVACTVRVPVEVIKQRSQTISHLSSLKILQRTLQTENIRGLFRGYKITILREIPFSFIQFPLWEYLKHLTSKRTGKAATPMQAGWCGFFAGGIAAAVTTPLDTAKTHIMLAQKKERAALGHMYPVLKDIYKKRGVKGLFAGVLPRSLWISIGGFLFLGTYEFVHSHLSG